MKWIVRVVVFVLVAVGALAVVGSLTPVGHHAASSIELDQPPQVVFDLLTDFERHGEWRDLESLYRLPDLDGLPYWRETGRRGAMDFVVEEQRPPHHFVTRIVGEDLPFGGRWIYDIDARPEGSVLTISEDGEIEHVIFRALSHYVFGYHATQQGYLREVAAHFGQTVEPVEADPRIDG